MITISYRRQDSLPVAGRLYDRLQAEFGSANVFMDFDSIPYGIDFRDHIKQAIERSTLVIAMIGPDWPGVRTGEVRRIDDPADFVRLEIAYAIRQKIPIIPVLINNTPMPRADELPHEIRELAFRNALMLDTGIDFNHHVDRLIRGVSRLRGDSVKSTPRVSEKPSKLSHKSRASAGPPFQETVVGPRLRMAVVLVGLGILISIAASLFFLTRASPLRLDKSIAVLPFENASDDKQNSYFADGVQDEILTSLSKIAELKVISRTSVMAYRGVARNIREIGKTLDVAAVLEGSVYRSRNRIRLNVRLIKAATDEQVWSEAYDRELTDVFVIQSELAKQIADVLRVRLSAQEKSMIERRPSKNDEAYQLYREAHAYESEPDETAEGRQHCEELLERAIQLDPSYALAYATLSRLESHIYHGFEPAPARLGKARAAAAQAIELQPNLPEAHLALGFVHYYGDRDYEGALQEFKIAHRTLPNDLNVYLGIGAIKRRQGKWDDAIANLKKVTELDPNRAGNWIELSFTYGALRDFPNASRSADRALVAAPSSFQAAITRARIALDWHGDLGPLEGFVTSFSGPDPEGRIAWERIQVRLLQRRYDEAVQMLTDSPRYTFEAITGMPMPKSFLFGITYWAAHELSKARANMQISVRPLEEEVQANRQSPVHHIALGQAYAILGRKDDAIREGRRAVELTPESFDALNGPDVTIGLAQVYVMTGDADAALPLIEHSLSGRVGITVPRLRLEPFWDPIRNDSRFEELLTKYGDR